MAEPPVRPQTPQAMLHRFPDKAEVSLAEGSGTRPSKYVVLLSASTAVAGKVQIARAVADALACPLFQGDSLHETSAKAASVGVAAGGNAAGANEGRYQRMWLHKMMRTGYLFPEESRPATEGFAGFGGGASSASTSRRGSASSGISAVSDATSESASSWANSYINRPPAVALSGRANPVLMVVTHPELQQWHKDCIRRSVGEYGIGIIFVPLNDADDDDDLPVLKPLDPRTMTSFNSLVFGARHQTAGMTLDQECLLRVNTEAKVEGIIDDIIDGVRDIIGP